MQEEMPMEQPEMQEEKPRGLMARRLHDGKLGKVMNEVLLS